MHVAINDKLIITIEAIKYLPISGVILDVVGVLSAIISMNTVSASNVVITNVMRSPVAGGNTNVNKPSVVMRKQGMIRLLK